MGAKTGSERAPEVYTAAEIVPIPARCEKCGYDWIDGIKTVSRQIMKLFPLRADPGPIMCRDAIRAPSLRGCRCFWCGGRLLPHPDHPPVIDAETARKTHQPSLFAAPKQ